VDPYSVVCGTIIGIVIGLIIGIALLICAVPTEEV
jgi:hypothetical protein